MGSKLSEDTQAFRKAVSDSASPLVRRLDLSGMKTRNWCSCPLIGPYYQSKMQIKVAGRKVRFPKNLNVSRRWLPRTERPQSADPTIWGLITGNILR